MAAFSDFDLLPALQTCLTDFDFAAPTEIQSLAIPILLAGRSLVGVAETGSGKTAAFALPILHALKTLEEQGDRITVEGRPRAVVLVPTRLFRRCVRCPFPISSTSSSIGSTDGASRRRRLVQGSRACRAGNGAPFR